MSDYKLLRPEVCEHGVDQRPHRFKDEVGVEGWRQNWCLKCLGNIDPAAALAAFKAVPVDRPAT